MGSPGSRIMPTKKIGKKHLKTLERIEIAVRLEFMNLGLSNSQIAEQIQMSVGAFNILKRTDEYKRLHTEYLTGICTKLDKNVDDTYETGVKLLTAGVPMALRNLVMNAAQKVDKKLQMEASKEILDRHGMFSKVARIGAPTKAQDEAVNAKDAEVTNEIINALSSAPTGAIPNNNIPITINSNPATDKVI